MNVKGFILEDDQGREFVMGCERPHAQLGRRFLLRGWQRRRLIPLQYSEREARHIVGEVLIALDDLFSTLLKRSHDLTINAQPQEQCLDLRRLPEKTYHRAKV
jgi:hypothetical protein